MQNIVKINGGNDPIPFAGCLAPEESLSACKLALLGVADDSQSSFVKGAAEAPQRIRMAYDGRSYNSTSESGVDLAGKVADLGDLEPLATFAETYAAISDKVEWVLSSNWTPFFIGGDHAVTVPILDGFRNSPIGLHIIQIDAHPDLYPNFSGNLYSHACTAARLLEMDHILSVTQLGIRSSNKIQREYGAEHQDRLRMLTARNLGSRPISLKHIPEGAPVYITIDLDGFDPAYAPGVSHPLPGGLTSRQIIDLIHECPGVLVGMDVVEVNPSRDSQDQTSILAARLLHEGMAECWRRLC